jgi:hypothetical protein
LEYSPEFCKPENQAILKGVYKQNMPNENPLFDQMDINEYIKSLGNLEKEQKVKRQTELVKIFGNPGN